MRGRSCDLTRRRGALALFFVLFAIPHPTAAQPHLPAPGGAPGSDSGDTQAVFTGLATSPQADLFTASSTSRIAIEVPPGRLAATPQLALRYSSNGSATPYGIGWTLPIPAIARSTRRGVPRFDDGDEFILELDGNTVLLEPVPGTSRYRAVKEGAYLRIGFDRQRNHWRVVDKSGTTFLFGGHADARCGREVSSADGTATWLLTRTVDTFGNHVDYEYLPGTRDEPGPGLPARIRYGGNLTTNAPHLFGVTFRWAPMPGPAPAVVSYDRGFAARSSFLLLAVETAAPRGIVRRYSLSHEVDTATADARLVAVSLDGYAADSSDDVALPSTVFLYSEAAPHDWPVGSEESRRARATTFPSPGAFRDSGSRIDFDTFDIDGDAIVDYVDTRTNPPSVRRGTPHGFGPAETWSWPATARRIRKIDGGNDIVINTFDIDGDGLADLVDARADGCGVDRWCVYRNNGDGFEQTATPWPARGNRIRAADVDGRKSRLEVADMNGDGLVDLVDATGFSGQSPFWNVHLNTGDRFAATPVRYQAPAGSITYSEMDGDRSFLLHGLFDMNGDGLPDFVLADVDELGAPVPLSRPFWHVYLNTGAGFTIEPVAWSVAGAAGFRLSNFLSSVSTDPETHITETYEELVDMNGDGRLDHIRHYSGADLLAFGLGPLSCQTDECSPTGSAVPPQCCFNTLVLLNTGSSFSAPTPWAAWHDFLVRSYSRSPSPSRREFDLFDFDGDGLVDLLEIANGEWRLFRHPASPANTSSPVPAWRRYRPNLLVAMLNGIGGWTRLEYAPVSAIPGNHLPFPRWALTRYDSYDGIGTTPAATSLLTYREAGFDPSRREFRGFRLAWQQDAIGRVAATEFHQDFHRAGLVERISLLASPVCEARDPADPADACSPWGRPLEIRENHWAESSPVLLNSHISIPFHNGRAIDELSKRIDYEYDSFGNVVTERVVSPSAGEVTTHTEYALSVRDAAAGLPELYIVDRPLRVTTRDTHAATAPLFEQQLEYDASPPRTGALTRARTCIDWSDSTCSRWRRLDYVHDRIGNLVQVRGPTGGTTRIRYDREGIYADRVTNAAAAVTTIERDLGTGRQTRTVLPDGRILTTDYDGIGRPLRHYRSGADTEAPAIRSRYFEGVAGASISWVRTDVLSSGPVVVFHDGLGRPRARKAWVDTADGVRTLVSGFLRYDGSGAIAAEGTGFPARSNDLTVLDETSEDVPGWTTFLRDTEGRVVETALPDGSRVRHDTSVPGVDVTIDANLSDGRFPGAARIEFRDGFGRTWRRDTCAVTPSPANANVCPVSALLSRTEYEYDGLDRVTRITAAPHTPNAAGTGIEYDGLGNRKTVISDNLGLWRYEHDDAGALIRASDPRGVTVHNAYDKLGRLRRQLTADTRSVYKYQRRGPGTGLVRRVTTKTTNSRVRKSFVYDQRARVVEDEWRLRAGGSSRTHTTSYGYDEADRRVSATYPSQQHDGTDVLRTEYTPFGLPFALTLETATGSHEIVRAVSYDLYGNVTRMDYGNDLSDRWTYALPNATARIRCTRTAHFTAQGDACTVLGSDLRSTHVRTRDAAGNPLEIADVLRAGGPSDASVAYAFDSLGRLTEAVHAGGLVERYAYDQQGNIAADNLQGAYLYGPAAPNLPVAIGREAVEHDAAGNRTRKGEWAYAYDGLGRLSTVGRAGAEISHHHYDEGGNRVAREDVVDGTTTYFVGGLLEIRGQRIVRRFHLANRQVAFDVVSGSGDAAAAAAPAAALRPANLHAAALSLLLVLTWLATSGNTPGVAGLTACVFACAALASPAVCGTKAHAIVQARASPGVDLFHLHQDPLGTPELVSDDRGNLVEIRHHASYGAPIATFAGNGEGGADLIPDLGFQGHPREVDSGLVYFGTRHYDPAIGLFLTPDPGVEHLSPYLYGGGNPVYAPDPDGEAIFGFLVALLEPILASAIIGSFLSAVTAAASGGDVAGALVDGLVSGAAGAGIGTSVGSLNIAYQYAAGGSQYVELGEALAASLQVAKRSAFTTSVAHAAATTTRALGGGSDWAAAASVAGTLAGSYFYDGYIVRDSGAATSAASQRGLARDGIRPVNTTIGHSTVTEEAAAGTGWAHQTSKLLRANLARDGHGSWLSRLRAVFNNEDHFGRLPKTVAGIESQVDEVVASGTSDLLGITPGVASGVVDAYTRAVGAATHFVQDHLTLGHMVPGTALFSGPFGAPIRFTIHQVFGGEVAFRNAQVRATRALLSHYGPAL